MSRGSGHAIMTPALDAMYSSLLMARVPLEWRAAGGNSDSLSAWLSAYALRIEVRDGTYSNLSACSGDGLTRDIPVGLCDDCWEGSAHSSPAQSAAVVPTEREPACIRALCSVCPTATGWAGEPTI